MTVMAYACYANIAKTSSTNVISFTSHSEATSSTVMPADTCCYSETNLNWNRPSLCLVVVHP